MEFLEYLIYKINEALKSIDGAQNREYHRLARFQQKLKDKMVKFTFHISFLLMKIEKNESKKFMKYFFFQTNVN